MVYHSQRSDGDRLCLHERKRRPLQIQFDPIHAATPSCLFHPCFYQGELLGSTKNPNPLRYIYLDCLIILDRVWIY